MKNLVVLSGAGISADSGLATFRDSGGLWEGYDINDVATVEAWHRNKEMVLDFYNLRRKQAAEAQPNAAHKGISKLDQEFNVTVITQNVDDLHERSGSENILHLHGLLREAKSEKNHDLVVDIGSRKIEIGDKASDGAQLRPNVVWFGEAVPMYEEAIPIVAEAEIFIVVGTSLAVYPAAALVDYVPASAKKYVVDPSIPDMPSLNNWTKYQETAAEGVPKLVNKLINSINNE